MSSQIIERKVGEVFFDKNAKITCRCVIYHGNEGDQCNHCALRYMGSSMACDWKCRSDRRSVCFKKVKKPVAGMIYRSESGQFYKLISIGSAVSNFERTENDSKIDQELFGYDLSSKFAWIEIDEDEANVIPVIEDCSVRYYPTSTMDKIAAVITAVVAIILLILICR
jgi:hypothetical protein